VATGAAAGVADCLTARWLGGGASLGKSAGLVASTGGCLRPLIGTIVAATRAQSAASSLLNMRERRILLNTQPSQCAFGQQQHGIAAGHHAASYGPRGRASTPERIKAIGSLNSPSGILRDP